MHYAGAAFIAAADTLLNPTNTITQNIPLSSLLSPCMKAVWIWILIIGHTHCVGQSGHSLPCLMMMWCWDVEIVKTIRLATIIWRRQTLASYFLILEWEEGIHDHTTQWSVIECCGGGEQRPGLEVMRSWQRYSSQDTHYHADVAVSDRFTIAYLDPSKKLLLPSNARETRWGSRREHGRVSFMCVLLLKLLRA